MILVSKLSANVVENEKSWKGLNFEEFQHLERGRREGCRDSEGKACVLGGKPDVVSIH